MLSKKHLHVALPLQRQKMQSFFLKSRGAGQDAIYSRSQSRRIHILSCQTEEIL